MLRYKVFSEGGKKKHLGYQHEEVVHEQLEPHEPRLVPLSLVMSGHGHDLTLLQYYKFPRVLLSKKMMI